MSNLVSWDPFSELRTTMDRLFDQGFARPWRMLPTTSYDALMPVDIAETAEQFEVSAAVPGVRPDDVDISVVGDQLTIRAHRQEEPAQEQDCTYHHQEILSGDYSRTFSLPTIVEADRAEARYENGILHLTLPKAESVRPRQIKLTGTDGDGHMLN